MVKLIGTDGNRYYSWDLPPGRYSIGRKSDNDLAIPSRTVSGYHAELEVFPDGETCRLTDLGSHNGTTVNGVKLSETMTVKAGDSITFGQAECRLTSDKRATESASRQTATELSDVDPEKSVYLSIDEALKPLPSKITDLPELFPTLSEMARTLVLPEPKEIMLKRSLSLVAQVIPAERLAVLFTSENQNNVYAAATLLPEGKAPGTFTLSRTIVSDILTHSNAVLVCNPEHDPRYAGQESIISAELKSAMAVPLFVEGKVFGILYVDTTNPMHLYNDDYLRLLATFGNIIASRLLNYSLLQAREEMQVMEAELRRASLIQQRLLVSESPRLPGYEIHAFQEQCRMVGGDLYDMVILPDGRLLFLLGDVSGKGMGAALLMSNLLASFRILYDAPDFDVSTAVAQVSRQLFCFSSTGDFATLFVGLLDPEVHRLTYVNAGHNPPLLVSRDGSRRRLEACGLMIGAFDSCDWPVQTVELSGGDLLVVFTDGVTEAEAGDQQYGDRRLEKLVIDSRYLEPKEIAGKVMKDIENFLGEIPYSDDITMLLLKRNV